MKQHNPIHPNKPFTIVGNGNLFEQTRNKIFNLKVFVDKAKKGEIDEEIGKVTIKKTIPLETFVSNDTKFKFHTYLCLVDEEFLPTLNKEHDGYAWCSFSKWPKPLHYGLQNTLNKKVNLKKLETVFEVINLLD